MIDPKPIHTGRAVLLPPLAPGAPLQRGYITGFRGDNVFVRFGHNTQAVATIHRRLLYWDYQIVQPSDAWIAIPAFPNHIPSERR